jgi:hypothetical protein
MNRDPSFEGDRTATRERASRDACDDGAVFDQIGAGFAELRKQLVELWSIKVAELRLSLIQKVFSIVLGVTALVVVLALAAASVFYLVAGTAEGLTAATGSPWLGRVLAGLVGLAVIAGGLFVAKARLSRAALARAKEQRDE